MIATITGAVIVFAVHGSLTLSYAPGLDVKALGWVLLVCGAGFGILFASPHYRRWRRGIIEED